MPDVLFIRDYTNGVACGILFVFTEEQVLVLAVSLLSRFVKWLLSFLHVERRSMYFFLLLQKGEGSPSGLWSIPIDLLYYVMRSTRNKTLLLCVIEDLRSFRRYLTHKAYENQVDRPQVAPNLTY
jgi:hypothetical protein